MKGISHHVDLIDAVPSEEQVAVYAALIRSLRDLAYEHIIFDFRNCDGTESGLQFYQLCRAGKEMHVEFRVDEPDLTMYARIVKEDEAISLLREMIETREAPDVLDWEDITGKVRSEHGSEND